jgi:CRP-like cAMP-binding protein
MKNDAQALAAFRTYLLGLAPLPRADVDAFLTDEVTAAPYAKGTFFTRVGDTHDRLGFVARGLFRVYYTATDGTYHVRNFCAEGRPIGSYATVLQRLPAHVDIEALEDALVLQFRYAALAKRLETNAAWERAGRRIAEAHYVSRERREHTLLTMDAAGRLAQFEGELGHLEHRLTAADVASYIGVRRETLSRLKRRRSR